MGWVQTIISILIIVMVIATAVNEPQLSFKYYKAMGESFIVMWEKTVHFIKGNK